MRLSHEKIILPFDIVYEKLMVILLHLSRYIQKCQIDDEAPSIAQNMEYPCGM